MKQKHITCVSLGRGERIGRVRLHEERDGINHMTTWFIGNSVCDASNTLKMCFNCPILELSYFCLLRLLTNKFTKMQPSVCIEKLFRYQIICKTFISRNFVIFSIYICKYIILDLFLLIAQLVRYIFFCFQ